jgi:enoyl-CoA hydratase/carnithine racemase
VLLVNSNEHQVSDTAAVTTAPVQYALRGPAAWITLATPERMNAIDAETLDAIAAGLDRSLADGARAVVLTGSGRAFCAGADLRRVLGSLDELSSVDDLLVRSGELMRRIEQHPVPVIAAVNGITIAGGLELVLACDLVIAADGATLADGHITYGLFPGAGGGARLARRIGPARAKDLLFTGRAASAQEMCDAGLVNRVVPGEALEPAVQALCEQLAALSRDALAGMKAVVGDGLDLSLDDAVALELDAARRHLRSPSVAEGLAAFAEGRRPDFSDAALAGRTA